MPQKRQEKYDEAARMYEENGLSVRDLAERFNVNRRVIYDALKIRNVKFRPRLEKGINNHFYRGYDSYSANASWIVDYAIRKGKLVPQPCEACGTTAKRINGANYICAHHDDYNKPLEVRWLCQKCHYEWHKHKKAIPRCEQ